MRYIVVDLEATCWLKGGSRDRMEIIEIGAVLLNSSSGPAVSEFGAFVRPVLEPVLSDFCRELTHIEQADVDGAAPFPEVLSRLLEWIGSEPFVLCSWGAYDLGQFETDCRRHKLPLPETFRRHVNLKAEFAEQRGIQPCGMAHALVISKLPLEGTHHRGIDDARNIGRIAPLVLPAVEARDGIEAVDGPAGNDRSRADSDQQG